MEQVPGSSPTCTDTQVQLGGETRSEGPVLTFLSLSIRPVYPLPLKFPGGELCGRYRCGS